MNSYQLKWKGKISGPHPYDEIMAMFEDRRIGPMHEISVDGNWITVRKFFRQTPAEESIPSPPSSPLPFPVSRITADSDPHNPIGDHLRWEGGVAPLAQSPAEPSTTRTTRVFEAQVTKFFAGVWTRACALVIDLLVVIYLPLWIIDLSTPTEILTVNTVRGLGTSSWIIFSTATSFTLSLYSVFLECSPLKATLGKVCLGLRVVTQTGDRMDFLQSSKRTGWKWVSSLMLLSGYFLAAFSPKKLTLHDIKAETFVVHIFNQQDAFNRH